MKTAVQLATEALILALDKTPRVNWDQAVMMALQSVKDTGYAEGYRVGSFDLKKEQDKAQPEASNDTGLETGLAAAAGMVSNGSHAVPIAQGQGEDKALANDRPSPEEAMEDLGWAFLKDFARQLGQLAIQYDVTPGAAELVSVLFQDNDRPGTSASLNFRLKNVTVPK